MKKAAAIILLYLASQAVFAQTKRTDSLKHLLAFCREDTTRVILLNKIGNEFLHTNLDSAISYQKRGLELAGKIHYYKAKAWCERSLGDAAASHGNYANALTWLLSALKQDEALNNAVGIADDLNAITYFYYQQGDIEESLAYGMKAYKAATPLRNGAFIIAVTNLGWTYCYLNKPDSALTCFLIAYHASIKNNSKTVVEINDGLGIAYGMLGKYDLSISFYNKGIGVNDSDQTNLSFFYRYESKMYKQKGDSDSCLRFAQRALTAANRSNNSKEKLESYRLLAKLYTGINAHTAVEYYTRESILSDSVNSAEKNKEVENLNFNEHERQQQLIEDARKAEETRKENLQLLAIALFIPFFFLSILWLSRTRTHRRVIEFMSVLSLLLAFEFVTLLIHPWIERLTNNTPVLELLILVILAAVLVPLHHNSTHWLKEKLVHGFSREKQDESSEPTTET